jgi:anaerobic selenocysteine-containing dehydrogenase
MAILALPAVGGKFGIRGGGFAMSDSAAWNQRKTWIGAEEPETRVVNMNRLGRALLELENPPIAALVVYNCNPPSRFRIRTASSRTPAEDLFTVGFDQVVTDARYADVVLPATTFLEVRHRKGVGRRACSSSSRSSIPRARRVERRDLGDLARLGLAGRVRRSATSTRCAASMPCRSASAWT